jgi:hypothetical protein
MRLIKISRSGMDLSVPHILARNVFVSMQVAQISSFGERQEMKDQFGFVYTIVPRSNLPVIRIHLPKNEKSSTH